MSLPSSPTRASGFSFTSQLGLLGRFISAVPPVLWNEQKGAYYLKVSANVTIQMIRQTQTKIENLLSPNVIQCNPMYDKCDLTVSVLADPFHSHMNNSSVELCKRKGENFRERSAAQLTTEGEERFSWRSQDTKSLNLSFWYVVFYLKDIFGTCWLFAIVLNFIWNHCSSLNAQSTVPPWRP